MIKIEDIVNIGWIKKDKTQGALYKFTIQEDSGKWMLALFNNPDEKGFYITEIIWVDTDIKFNEWENGDRIFSGFIKTIEDLSCIMQLTGISEYKR